MRRLRGSLARTNLRRAVPNVLWAQRKEFVLLKIDLPDVKNEKIDIEGTKLHFTGESQGRSYSAELDLHAEVVKEVSVRPLIRNPRLTAARSPSGPFVPVRPSSSLRRRSLCGGLVF